MNFTIVQVFGYSLILPALIGLVRSKKISQAYTPFIVLLLIGLLNEVCTTIIVINKHSNAINSNIYVLIESVLLLILFKNWGLFDKSKILFIGILFLFAGAWITDNFFISKITRFSSYFRIIYGFTIVLLSISMVNHLVTEETNWNSRRGQFVVLIGFIVFFTYQTLVEIFWVYGLNSSREFRRGVYRIMTYINLSVNLIYAIGLLWIPRKKKSLLL